MTRAERRRIRRRRPKRWPRPLSPAELDVYGRGYNEGWEQGFACGQTHAR
jgi:hypothetical protein